MTCSGLEILGSSPNITSIMTFPLTCDYYFYLKFMVAIFIVIAFGLWFKDREKMVRADIISCLGVSALATIFLSIIGTLIGIIQPDIFILIMVVGLVLVAMWLLKK